MSFCVTGALAFSAVFSAALLWACATRVAPTWEKAKGDPVRQWSLRLAGWAALIQLIALVLLGIAEWLRPPFFNFCTGVPGLLAFCLLYSSSGLASLLFWAAGSVLARKARGVVVWGAALFLLLVAVFMLAYGIYVSSAVTWNRFQPEIERAVSLLVGALLFGSLMIAWGYFIEKAATPGRAVAVTTSLPAPPAAPASRASRVFVPDEPPSVVPVARPRDNARASFVDREHVFAAPDETGVKS